MPTNHNGVAQLANQSRRFVFIIKFMVKVQNIVDVLIRGRRGASVEERRHRAGGCQGDSRCRHVGGGEHKRAAHGT